MRILIKGFGSIARRHAGNLLSLGFTDITLVSTKSNLGEGFNHLKKFPNLDSALENNQYTHGFICSPTAFHIEDLNSFLDADIRNIYLEKPISHNWNQCQQLLNRIDVNAFRVQVGFDLHFDPGLMKAQQIIQSQVLGKIYSANAFVGQYLPDWRPYEDHRLGMSAFLEKGGGVMLDLVHEFDYLLWLLGNPKKIMAFYQKNPQLEIETEDLADVLIQFESGVNSTIHLDYHQRKLIRYCIFTAEKGTIKWDLAERSLTVVQHDKTSETFDFSNFERNDRYLQIVEAFMKDADDPRLTSYKDGLQSLKMVLLAKASSENETMTLFNTL
jgi:predicted dehydrogenase